jgi:hypothetical protein
MARQLAILAAWLAIIVVALLLLLDVAYFMYGSFEMYPTEERQSGIRLLTGILAVLLTLIEVGLWLLLRVLRRSPIFSKHA